MLTFDFVYESTYFSTRHIVYVAGGGDYSDIMMAGGKKRTVTCQLGQVEDMLSAQLGQNGSHLVRIGKSLIINMNYLSYINPSKKQIILSDCKSLEFSLSASREALTDLKIYFDSLIGNN